ncbi:MAG: hypothetical protein Q8Q01_00025 [archaeon]|nr:hypothetical protein [archaeon]
MLKQKKGGLVIQVLVLMVLVVISSSVLLFLINKGVITVKESGQTEPILQANFLPIARTGTVAVKEFAFCSDVNEDFECIGQRSLFQKGDKVHFKFVVETNPYGGDVIIFQNYRLINPNGVIILEAEDMNNYQYDARSDKTLEEIVFKDYIITEENDIPGTYRFELLVSNPLLEKDITVTEEFTLAGNE